MGQGLGGLAPGLNRGATMSGNKPSSGAEAYPMKFAASGKSANTGLAVSTSFTPTQPGRYLFVAWGAGGKADGGLSGTGGGGALAMRTVRLAGGQTIPIHVGSCSNNSDAELPTIVTFQDGTMTAGGGQRTATGGGSPSGLYDVGVAGTAAGGAAGAYLGFIGGSGPDVAPGGGFTGGRIEVYRVGD